MRKYKEGIESFKMTTFSNDKDLTRELDKELLSHKTT